ncbi:MAG: serine/threonine-protein kinase [Trueperaceae bacterium]|nr:serine/threonine-protein kinase [Trueperaceae bacterium]
MLKAVRVLAENGPVRVELARSEGRLVVVKRLVGFHPVLERRLAREAEVVRKLDHPGILPLLWVRDGVLVYPFLPGVNLADALRAGPLPWRRARRIGVEALRALDYAHGHGIIHHDVKPGNLVQRGERTILLDFGFAKDLALSSITAISSAMGTPNYMAPEQFGGVRDDPRSDIYAVGAVLYHAVAGEPPYGREVLRMLAGERPELAPVPARARALADWIRTALAPAPSARFQSAAEMLAAVPDERAQVAR